MNPSWTDVSGFVVSLVGLVVTTIGLYAVFIQLRKVKEALWSDTHSRLCDQSLEILKFMAENPSTRDYFYNQKELEPTNDDRIMVLFIAEANANFLEHLVLQRKSMPTRQWGVWERFIRNTYENSPIIQDFITAHTDWYSDELIALLETCSRYQPKLTATAEQLEHSATSKK